MLSLFSLLLFFFLLAVFVVLLALRLVSRFLFGRRSRRNVPDNGYYHAAPHGKMRKKVFEKDEGEYVDFEEVDDGNK